MLQSWRFPKRSIPRREPSVTTVTLSTGVSKSPTFGCSLCYCRSVRSIRSPLTDTTQPSLPSERRAVVVLLPSWRWELTNSTNEPNPSLVLLPYSFPLSFPSLSPSYPIKSSREIRTHRSPQPSTQIIVSFAHPSFQSFANST